MSMPLTPEGEADKEADQQEQYLFGGGMEAEDEYYHIMNLRSKERINLYNLRDKLMKELEEIKDELDDIQKKYPDANEVDVLYLHGLFKRQEAAVKEEKDLTADDETKWQLIDEKFTQEDSEECLKEYESFKESLFKDSWLSSAKVDFYDMVVFSEGFPAKKREYLFKAMYFQHRDCDVMSKLVDEEEWSLHHEAFKTYDIINNPEELLAL